MPEQALEPRTAQTVHWEVYGHADRRLRRVLQNAREPATLGSRLLEVNGSFAAVGWKSREEAILVTDPSGSIPLCYGRKGGLIAAGIRADEIAAALGRCPVDPLSAADFIANGTVCYPHTLFEDVFVCPPGAVARLTPDGLEAASYYVPEEVDAKGSSEHWGERLRQALAETLECGLEAARRVGVMFSGGEDSRVVTALLPPWVDACALTLADGDNREVRLARRAARAMDVPFDFVPRPEGFYREALHERVKAVGAGRDARHTHVWGGTAESFRGFDAVVGGYAADTMFKSLWMGNVRPGRRSLRPDALLGPAPDRPVGVRHPSELDWLAGGVAAEVYERRRRHHERLVEFRPQTAGNWHQRWPLGTQRVAYPHYLAALSAVPRVVEPFLWARLYRLAAAMPDAHRMDARAFRAAFARSLGRAGWLPTSSGRIPRVGGWIGHYIGLAIKLEREGRDRVRPAGSLPQGAWNPDHAGFDVDGGRVLGHERAERLGAVLGELLGPSQRGDVSAMLGRLSLPERIRAVQIGCAFAP